MKKIYYLSTCSTCARIIEELGLKNKKFEFQDIKTDKITAAQLKEMKDLLGKQSGTSGSYEALFSRIALKYRALGLDKKKLGEEDYKKYILEEYTFLKRPVIITGDKIFVGNSKNAIAAAKQALS
jgi:arsenate reductase (glutaredoxin)